MIASAQLIALRATTAPLEWYGADPTGTVLPAAGNDSTGRCEISTFVARDDRLAYRDQVVAAAIIEMALAAANVWGFRVERPGLIARPYFTAAPDTSQAGIIVASGSVTYVNNGSTLSALGAVDISLYNRDLILYNALEQIADQVLGSSPLPASGLALSLTDVWSLAQEVIGHAGLAEIIPMLIQNISNPDQHLAYRDNTLAAYVARMSNVMNGIFLQAQRFLVNFTPGDGSPPHWEIMNLQSDNGVDRVWVGNLASGLALNYNHTTKQVFWVDTLEGTQTNQQSAPTGPSYSFAGYAAGVLANILPKIPPFRPAAWFLAQASLPAVEDQIETTAIVSSTNNPVSWRVGSPAVFSDPSLLTWVSGTLNFAVPNDLPAGAYRVSVGYST